MDTFETITSNDGNLRVRVDYDPCPLAPDGDFFGTVLREGTSYYDTGVSHVASRHQCDDGDIEDAYETLSSMLQDIDQVENVLRGNASVCMQCDQYFSPLEQDIAGVSKCDYAYEEGGLHEMWESPITSPVVGFDTLDLRDRRFINIVTLADLNIWGWKSVAEFNEVVGNGKDPSDGNLKEFEAWAEGDVYMLTTESRVFVDSLVSDAKSGAPIRMESSTDWDEMDGLVGGYYGLEYALQTAHEIVDSYNRSGEAK